MQDSSSSLQKAFSFWSDALEENQKRYNFTDFRVLVLNENHFMQSLLSQMLRGFGVSNIVCVRDTDAAWQEVEAQTFDFMLIDWMIEPLDGRAFVRKIRASRNKELRLVPIIMITGHSEQNRVEAARDAGANEFLTLPLAAMTLFDRIVSLIDRPRPFIRTRTFFGPCRRRRNDHALAGMRRRSTDTGFHGDENATPAAAAHAQREVAA